MGRPVTRRLVMRWHLRQVMATRGIFQTSELVPLLADRGGHLTRQYVHKLVPTAPQPMHAGPESRASRSRCESDF